MFLVIADTYTGGYGTELTLFGVFPTEKEAVNFILNEPVKKFCSGFYPNGEEDFGTFDFLKYYESEKTRYIYESQGSPKNLGSRTPMIPTGQRTMPKEEYVLRYIKEFNDKPIYLGGYCE